MYMKDLEHRVTVRLTDDQYRYLNSAAEVLGVSCGEFLRMTVNASLISTKHAANPAAEVPAPDEHK